MLASSKKRCMVCADCFFGMVREKKEMYSRGNDLRPPIPKQHASFWLICVAHLRISLHHPLPHMAIIWATSGNYCKTLCVCVCASQDAPPCRLHRLEFAAVDKDREAQ